MKEIKVPETRLLSQMFREIEQELTYINGTTVPALVSTLGPVLNTGIVLRVAELPSLLNAPRLGTGAVLLRYKDEIKFNGRKAVINKPKFLEKYYRTEEGQNYKKFVESLEPGLRRQFEIF